MKCFLTITNARGLRHTDNDVIGLLTAYGLAKSTSGNPMECARLNIDALRTIRDSGELGPATLERIRREIATVEAIDGEA
jgi:hypothetical protein